MTLVTLILLIACGALGFYFWKNRVRARRKQLEAQAPLKSYAKDELRIENVGPGAVIHLTGIGPDMDEFDLKVIAKHTYRQGESNWYELECDKGSENVWIDMEEDDELELAVTLRKLKLRDIGIDKDDLTRMDDDEEGKFEFEGDTYWLEDSDAAVFYRYSDDKNAENFYYWDFEVESGKKSIGVEKWSNGSYDVGYHEAIKLSQVTIYSLG
ncbi:MAG TPA: hypothetical protein DDZ83_13600 [Nitrospinae bacterium]|nr:hypothetical protein [Nitrospinota bacterium]